MAMLDKLISVRVALLLTGLGLGAAACGGSASVTAGGSGTVARSETGKEIKTIGGQAINLAAHNKWKEGVAAFKAADKQGWNDARCDEVSGKFESAADAQSKFAEALYMAGAAHLKCGGGHKQKALAFFQKALRQNPKLCKARVGIGLDDIDGGRDQAGQQEFEMAVHDDPQCTEGYVNIAILQRRKGDTKEALNNLRRALAIDAQYLPAFNEMALLYLQNAKDNVKELDLAEVVCSQSQKIDANFAPIYNTWGLIDLRRKEIINASAKFQKAFELDPKMFEAYMNFAQITIGFRGYEDARNAFTKALELQPKSFDATVGLGVAYRGLEQKDKAEEFYNKARDLNANRPEPYYNLGVLYQDFKGGSVDDVKKARGFYEQFLSRAGSDDRFRVAVDDIKRRCKTVKGQRRPNDKCISGRFQNIEDYLQALKDMEEMEKLQKESERQQAEMLKEEKAEQARQAAQPKPAAAPPPAAPAAPPAKGEKPAPGGPAAAAPAAGAPAENAATDGKGKAAAAPDEKGAGKEPKKK
jgi:tetratricopeptide (TPR) repeat protein